MSAITVKPVRTHREKRILLLFPWHIYRSDPLWVPPLMPQRTETIDPSRGSFFKHGEAEFFIAWKDGEPVGTICAAEDKAANRDRSVRECVFGFFEYENDLNIAAALIEEAKEWAGQRGLNALFGPFNLDYEDSYGVLIEGRDRPPALMCGHTPPYYLTFMENYGFQPARGDNLAYAIEWQAGSRTADRISRLAGKLREKGHITVRPADFDHWPEEIDRVHCLLLKALAHLPDFIPWQRESLEGMVAPFRQIADPELILFADVDGETVGWLPGIPNLNEVFIRVNGLRRPWDYAKLWWLMRRPTASLTIKSVLVLPEYWNTGVAVLLIDEMAKRSWEKGYRWADLSLTSDDNPNTPILAEKLGAKIYKRYRVYRLQF